ncbi:MAG: hypothetical protein SFW07_05725 [Gammaproteobacteria bacterium]|nr:hypothetical protein [Gammaproteobacteria bacterium]
MDDKSVKRAASVEKEKGSDDLKKPRGTFFNAEIELQIDGLKRELRAKTYDNFHVAMKKYAEISEPIRNIVVSYSEKYDPINEALPEISLESYGERLKYFFEFCQILKKFKPFRDFVNLNLLVPMRETIRKIWEVCGCDLNHPTTLALAKPYTEKLSALANDLEDKISNLYKKEDDLCAEMQKFIFTYKYATEEEKTQLQRALERHPVLMTWSQPWIDIANGKKGDSGVAFFEAMELLPEIDVHLLEQPVNAL